MQDPTQKPPTTVAQTLRPEGLEAPQLEVAQHLHDPLPLLPMPTSQLRELVQHQTDQLEQPRTNVKPRITIERAPVALQVKHRLNPVGLLVLLRDQLPPAAMEIQRFDLVHQVDEYLIGHHLVPDLDHPEQLQARAHQPAATNTSRVAQLQPTQEQHTDRTIHRVGTVDQELHQVNHHKPDLQEALLGRVHQVQDPARLLQHVVVHQHAPVAQALALRVRQHALLAQDRRAMVRPDQGPAQDHLEAAEVALDQVVHRVLLRDHLVVQVVVLPDQGVVQEVEADPFHADK